MPLSGLRIVLFLFLTNALASLSIADDNATRSILILGDSLTVGLGIDPDEAYPAILARKIDEADLPYEIISSGLSGETSAGGLRRIDWVLRQPIAILILALGANDGLRGIDLSDTEKNLQGIIDKTRTKNPDVRIVIAGMQMPPNLGETYTTQFKNLYPNLSETNNAYLIPFLLENVAGHAHLNLGDGIHPNPAGHKIVAQNVWETLEPILSP